MSSITATGVSTSLLDHLPDIYSLAGKPLPIDRTDGQIRPANSQKPGNGSTVEDALNNHQPRAAVLTPDQAAVADGPARGGKPAAAATTQPRVTPSDIDAKAVLERIAGEWKQAGVNPAWIAIIKAPDTWSDNRQTNRPALLELTAELRRTGEFNTLRKQAMRLIQATPLWRAAVDKLTAREHDPSRDESREFRRALIEHRLAARFFGLNTNSLSDKTNTLELIINAKAAADVLTPAGGMTMDELSGKAKAFMIVAGVEPDPALEDETEAGADS